VSFRTLTLSPNGVGQGFRARVATGDADAITPADGGGGGGGDQTGLVNVIIADNTVQVPLAVAASVCDVTVAVLVNLLEDDAAACVAAACRISPARMRIARQAA
jgi:hypothetical protein